MVWTKENIIAACIFIAGSNISGVANMVSPTIRANSFSNLDAALMKEEILETMNRKFTEEHARHVENEIHINNMLWRITQCEKYNDKL